VKLLVELAEKTWARSSRGLPRGAKDGRAARQGEGSGSSQSSAQVRSALLKMRQQVPDLGVAKSTFFAFTDEKGIAIRNDLEQDTMAGKDIVSAYPDFKKAIAGEAYVATQGTFPGVRTRRAPTRSGRRGAREARGQQPHRPPRHRLDLPGASRTTSRRR